MYLFLEIIHSFSAKFKRYQRIASEKMSPIPVQLQPGTLSGSTLLPASIRHRPTRTGNLSVVPALCEGRQVQWVRELGISPPPTTAHSPGQNPWSSLSFLPGEMETRYWQRPGSWRYHCEQAGCCRTSRALIRRPPQVCTLVHPSRVSPFASGYFSCCSPRLLPVLSPTSGPSTGPGPAGGRSWGFPAASFCENH